MVDNMFGTLGDLIKILGVGGIAVKGALSNLQTTQLDLLNRNDYNVK